MTQTALAAEWTLLQNQYDSYEKHSLWIKLVALVLVTLVLLMTALNGMRVPASLLVISLSLWMQEAIWKTFQARIEARLLRLEVLLTEDAENAVNGDAYQYNTAFAEQRPGTAGLVLEYVQAARRPTVAFPHIVLVALLTYGIFY
ncbi:hypothetical protein EYC98_09070 [Halieaceae bacterium IMCC14734]|uniref:Uncharacterized protein n=1 Tax=Candidatus Litorirhabdus singularis TaxID=2518993 RepID=A0ABT3TFC1_9GAMM|nr:hypothetical protein [Candidatus Litorirhabdus singularis]MCX2981013.1 hypothetical protein [Candidatus Litorirhabdus singularis]